MSFRAIIIHCILGGAVLVIKSGCINHWYKQDLDKCWTLTLKVHNDCLPKTEWPEPPSGFEISDTDPPNRDR